MEQLGILVVLFLQQLDRNKFGKIVCTFRTKPLTKSKICDLWISYEELQDLNSFKKIDLIVFLVTPRSAAREEYASHVLDTRIIFKNAAQAGIKGIVYASSQAVYGIQPLLWTEFTKLAPITPYGWSKLTNEQSLKQVNSNENFKGISLRFPKLIGPGNRFRIDQGEVPHKLIYNHLTNKKIQLSNSFLKQIYDFWDVRDAANALQAILLKDQNTWPKEMNVGAQILCTGADLLLEINNCCKKENIKEIEISMINDSSLNRDFEMCVNRMQSYIGAEFNRELNSTTKDIFDFVRARVSRI